MAMQVRQATINDLDRIMCVIEAARMIMQENGNPHQWVNGYPSVEVIQHDISEQSGFVLLNEQQQVVAYFAFYQTPDPTYNIIYEGEWLNDLPYGVVHRISSLPCVHGTFEAVLRFCSCLNSNLRVDTHRDNSIMQHLLIKRGFKYCGIIHVANGDERLAFQRFLS